MLDITPEVGHLESAILASGTLPRKAAIDAAHIAIAAVHGIDFLLTWNCVHIANGVIAKAVVNICRQDDWQSPVICTPEELFQESFPWPMITLWMKCGAIATTKPPSTALT
jgi:hypothetical protein